MIETSVSGPRSTPWAIGTVEERAMRAAQEQGTGRNDPCPCDSGRKFKKCCGA